MKKLTKVLAFAACAAGVLALLGLAACGQSSGGAAAVSQTSAASSESAAPADSATPASGAAKRATLVVEGYDPVTIELDAAAAPKTVQNFCELAQSGYYDGLTFYRFVEGFCMQGGTAGNTASGNDPALTPIEGEFAQNGIDNALADEFGRGVVAMARTSDPNSATSTFFVTLDSSQGVSMSLNGQYAAFGTIDEAGMQTIDRIVADYMPNVTDAQMGVIAEESQQAKIASITVEG